MFKNIRIAVLIYALLFVAASNYLTSKRARDWDATLWIDVYTVNGDGKQSTQNYIDQLDLAEFSAIEGFFGREAQRFGIELDRPFRFGTSQQTQARLPYLPERTSILDTLIFSLKMRWLATTLNWSSDGPSPDILLFAVFHDSSGTPMLERSGALRKGLIVVANIFARRSLRSTNQVVIAHELLHTVGASDKYDLESNHPLWPGGFADPNRVPLYPQVEAELMGGRIPVSEASANIPASLKEVLIGPQTATEIGWLSEAD